MNYSSAKVLADVDHELALGQVRPLQFTHDSGSNDHYWPAIGLFGTAGGPEVPNWRGPVIQYAKDILVQHGLEAGISIYNPQKPEWRPEDAKVEAGHLATDKVIMMPVLDITSGNGSLAETGFAALGSMLRPQKTHLMIESGTNYDDGIQRARQLTTILARKTLHDFPINIELADTIDTMTHSSVKDAIDFATLRSSRVQKESKFTIERQPNLKPTIALVGSGAPRYEDSWYEGTKRQLENFGVRQSEVFSAYVKDWTTDDAVAELEHKTKDAVILFATTEDQSSFGAMGELGWLMTYAVLNGQKLGVYVESHKSDPKSDENRQRKLAMAHLSRQLADFPDLSDSVYIAGSPKELAMFGASELAKYRQFQLAANYPS